MSVDFLVTQLEMTLLITSERKFLGISVEGTLDKHNKPGKALLYFLNYVCDGAAEFKSDISSS